MTAETRQKLWVVVATFVCLALMPVAYGGQDRVDPRDWSDDQRERFLLNADIGDMREIGTGVTRPRRAELDDGAVRHDAHVQTVDEFLARFEGQRSVELNFTDSYKYNIAAYRLDRLLGLDMVPVSVERTVRGDRAALTWWVDDVQMMLADFYEDELQPPNFLEWSYQMMHIRLFNELIFNTDANLGNFVIDEDWAVHMVDFTRAFRTSEALRAPEDIANIRVSRHVVDALRLLDFETLDEVMEDLLTDTQIRALLARRDLIVENLDAQIKSRGEAGVLRD